jgi:hypothetical protein
VTKTRKARSRAIDQEALDLIWPPGVYPLSQSVMTAPVDYDWPGNV